MKKILLLSALIIIGGCNRKTEIKNVIIMIGDGMGPQQLGILTQYARQAPSSVYKDKKTGFEKAIEQGDFTLSLTYPGNGLVTDSAASATQFSSGEFAGAEMLGATVKGDPTCTILKVAKDKGMKVGLVSDAKISHATPASFVAKSSHRDLEGKIAEQLAKSGTDVMLAGGASYWVPRGSTLYKDSPQGAFKIKSKRKDDLDLIKVVKDRGYDVAFNLAQLNKSEGAKLVGLFSNSHMPDAIKAKRVASNGVPELIDMTKKALSILKKSEKGFVLLVEAGQIDFAGHRNDIGLTLHEMMKFDVVVDYIRNWVKGRDDTVAIISADHETGGPSFSFNRYELPKPKSLFGGVFKGARYLPNYNFGNVTTLDKIFKQSMSFQEIFELVGESPEKLVEMVAKHTEYSITFGEAKRVLELEKNIYYKPDHPKLHNKMFPRVDDFETFYVDPKKMRPSNLARILARRQNVVWSTGTHTNTPVPFIILGPDHVRKRFKGLLHTTIWGKKLIDLIN